MPVDKEHSDYSANIGKWQRCRDTVNGQDAIHAAGEKYLPKLKEQTPEDYNGYVQRALFFNATQRTVEGLVGMVFRKPPVIEVPAGMKDLLDDVTLSGIDSSQFAQACLGETIGIGRVGILVDYPVVDQQPATIAEAERGGARPFMVRYESESIINWRTERIAGKMTLTLAVLKEKADEVEDEFTSKQIDQIRVLKLVGGVYNVELWRKKQDNSGEWEKFKAYTPVKRGGPLDYIPFVIVGARTIAPEVEKPPLLDLVDVNLSHYRTSADLEHGAHFCGLPTVVVSGYRPDDTSAPLYIGSAKAWVFPQSDARASYLEFGGQGLGTLSDLKAAKEAAMAALGARMLSPDKKEAEAAETAAIHRSGEVSVLATIAQTLARAYQQALEWMADWNGNAGDVECKLNTDYFPLPLASADITALVSAWQQGAISKETLFYNLKRGEVIPEETTFEDEDAAIGDEPPVLSNQLDALDAQGNNAMKLAQMKPQPQGKPKGGK